MMEKLSSLWVRFMPTLVSPATSMRSNPPTTVDRRKDARMVSTRRCSPVGSGWWRLGRRGEQIDRDLSKCPGAEHEQLHRVADRMPGDCRGQTLRAVDGLSVDRDDHVS